MDSLTSSWGPAPLTLQQWQEAPSSSLFALQTIPLAEFPADHSHFTNPQINFGQALSSQDNLCFQLWQDLFCTWKYKQLQTRENGGIGPRSLSSAKPQSSQKGYSCTVSSCSNNVDMRRAQLCRPTIPSNAPMQTPVKCRIWRGK